MNPFAYSTALFACKTLVESHEGQDNRLHKEAVEAAYAALTFTPSPVVYLIATRNSTKAPWVIDECEYVCAFEAETQAEKRFPQPVQWRIIALTGMSSEP